MNTFSKLLLALSAVLALLMSHQSAAQGAEDIKEYCQSMMGAGMSEEDLQAFMNDCIAEQSSYVESELSSEQYDQSTYDQSTYEEPQYEETQYEEYTPEQNCYEKADEHIQKLMDTDPNTDFDYDQLIEQCLKGKL